MISSLLSPSVSSSLLYSAVSTSTSYLLLPSRFCQLSLIYSATYGLVNGAIYGIIGNPSAKELERRSVHYSLAVKVGLYSVIAFGYLVLFPLAGCVFTTVLRERTIYISLKDFRVQEHLIVNIMSITLLALSQLGMRLPKLLSERNSMQPADAIEPGAVQLEDEEETLLI